MTPHDVPQALLVHEDTHTVTVTWEPGCPDAEVGLCEDPDCGPKTQGEWMAVGGNGNCSFLVMAAADQRTCSRTHRRCNGRGFP